MNKFNRLYEFLSTAFGLGLLPIMPGTWGSLLGVAIHGAIYFTLRAVFFPAMIIALAIVCAISIPLGYWAETHWKRKDPKPFVLDEVAGYLLTAAFFSTGNLISTVFWVFFMSRLFDIIKPWPVGIAERAPGGWGILLDDLAASVCAIISLLVMGYLIPEFMAFKWLLPAWLVI